MAKKKAYRIWCEYDMGWENKVFSTKKKAMDAIKAADWDLVNEENHENLWDAGLLGIEEIDYE